MVIYSFTIGVLVVLSWSFYDGIFGHQAHDDKCLTYYFPFHVPVPGAPKDIIATPINSTTINVRWSPPDEKERNGIIRGYHIHVQEASLEVKQFAHLEII